MSDLPPAPPIPPQFGDGAGYGGGNEGGNGGGLGGWDFGGPRPSGTPPLNVGEILDRSFRLWWKTLRQSLPWTFLLVLPLQVVSALEGRRSNGVQGWLREVRTRVEQAPPGASPTLPPFPFGSFALLITLGVFVGVIVRAALTAYYTDRILLRNTPIGACIRASGSIALTLVGVGLLSTLVTLSGVVLCCIGVVATATLVSVASQVAVVERAKPVQAIKRSLNLVQRRFWPMMAILFLTVAFRFVISFPFNFVSSLFVETPGPISVAAQVMLNSAGVALGLTLDAVMFVFAYLDLRVRFERLDLGVVAAGLGLDGRDANP